MSNKISLERGMRKLADDELMHWKYIKRVRKSDGTYRYYYDRTNNVLKNLGDARQQTYRMERAILEVEKNRRGDKNYSNASKSSNYLNAHAKTNAWNKEELRYWKAHPMAYKADLFVDKNAPKLVKHLNKVSDTISKAKRWIKGLFSNK